MPANRGRTEHFENVRHSPATSTRILIADADADTRALYRDAFALADWDVIEATDGRDALAKAFAYPPSLVITELTLPFVDGYALCDILRHDPLTVALPILVVTAEARPAHAERAQQIGVDAVLLKPATPDIIVREARRLLATSQELRARSTGGNGRPSEQPSAEGLRRSKSQHRIAHAKMRQRFTTTSPPTPPPVLSCPSCDRALKYEQSYIGGVSDRHPEQWDYFVCPAGCGTFQYRQRTRRVRRVG